VKLGSLDLAAWHLGSLDLAAWHLELVAQQRDLDVLAYSLRKLPSNIPTSRRVMR
jgi:hypothetical protein